MRSYDSTPGTSRWILRSICSCSSFATTIRTTSIVNSPFFVTISPLETALRRRQVAPRSTKGRGSSSFLLNGVAGVKPFRVGRTGWPCGVSKGGNSGISFLRDRRSIVMGSKHDRQIGETKVSGCRRQKRTTTAEKGRRDHQCDKGMLNGRVCLAKGRTNSAHHMLSAHCHDRKLEHHLRAIEQARMCGT